MVGIDDIVGAGLSLINKLVPDPALKAQAQQKWLEMDHQERTQILGAQADIIKAEASSESWLAANWRPLVMVTFTGLIVARWFGWAAPNLSPGEYTQLWDIVQVGMGGYVVGRSVEKVVPAIADAVVAAKGK